MIAIFNRLPVKEGAVEQIVKRFANSRGNVQEFPGFVSLEVLRSEEEDEVLVITRWRDKDAFDSWVRSDAFKKAHGTSGGGDLLRGHPQMSTYEVAVERELEAPGGPA
jgi:heme oxygenase (staphylobilin-producing)